MNAVDLDVHMPVNKTVTLAGVQYIVPGDMPMETYIAINAAAVNQEDDADEVELMLQMKRAAMDLLLWEVDTATEEGAAKRDALDRALMRRSVRFIAQLVSMIYSRGDGDGDGDVIEGAATDVDPTTAPSTGGTTSTTPALPSPSAS